MNASKFFKIKSSQTYLLFIASTVYTNTNYHYDTALTSVQILGLPDPLPLPNGNCSYRNGIISVWNDGIKSECALPPDIRHGAAVKAKATAANPGSSAGRRLYAPSTK